MLTTYNIKMNKITIFYIQDIMIETMVHPGIKEGGMLRLRCSVLIAFSKTN